MKALSIRHLSPRSRETALKPDIVKSIAESYTLKTINLGQHSVGFFCLLAIATSSLNAQEPAAPAKTEPPGAVTTAPAVVEPEKAPVAEPPKEPVRDEAAEQRRRFAVTDLNQVDADYHNQGEYGGDVLFEGCRRQIGLQVMALGDGKFDALLYRGGLPGNGYDFSSIVKLSGSRSGDQVILTGDNLIVYLQTGYAGVVKTAAGVRLGFLQPMKRLSQTLGLRPPSNAIVLFDGRNTDQLVGAKVTPDGLLESGFETKSVFQNFTIHGEFRVPYMPYARGQDRGNSGFYLQRRYEVQVLDSFGLESKFNDCAALYRFKTPALNMCFPPLRWQTYDIVFNGAKFAADGKKICKARVTVLHNGVMVHNQLELENKTGGGKVEGPDPLHILFQNHRNPVHYRNLWIVDHDQSNCGQSPCAAMTAPACYATPCGRDHGLRHMFRQ